MSHRGSPTESLFDLIAFAVTAHVDQRDKADAPYLLHPLRMMLKMTTVEEQIAAVLHDVTEDCGARFEDGSLHAGDQSGLGVDTDEILAAQYPNQRTYLPIHRLEDRTMTNW